MVHRVSESDMTEETWHTCILAVLISVWIFSIVLSPSLTLSFSLSLYIYLFYLSFFNLKFYGSIVDLQCYVSFRYTEKWINYQFSSVTQSCPTLCDPMNCSTPGLPVHHNCWSSLKLVSIKSVMPSSHLILCRPLLLLPPVRPSIRVFSNESTLRMRWPKYWSFSFSIRINYTYTYIPSFC